LLMRVLYISSVYKPAYVYGGPARSVPALCEGLAESGAGIEVFTTNANGRARLNVALERRLVVDGVAVTYFPLRHERYLYAPALLDALRQQVRRFDVVAIDALFSGLFEPAASICREAAVPYIVPPRGQLLPWALREKRWKKMLYLNLAGRRSLNAAAGIHCTDSMEAEALQRAGVRAPAFVAPNGIEARATADGSSLRRELAMPDSSPLLLYAGRFHRVKRLDVAVATLASIPAAYLLLVGPDEENLQASLRRQASSSGCADRLRFLPLQPGGAMLRVYAAADLFILPSDMESFGMAAAEAMASGLPLLASDHVPVGRWAVAANAGWVASNRGGDFACAAQALLSLPRDALVAMGRRAHVCAEENFGRSAAARRYLECVAPLCRRPN